MSKVRDMIGALVVNNQRAEFKSTGGGCHAIEIPLGTYPTGGDDYSAILITGNDVFTWRDLDADDDLDGVWFVGLYGPDGGDLVEEAVVEEDDRPFAEVVAEVVRASRRLADSHASRHATTLVVDVPRITDEEVAPGITVRRGHPNGIQLFVGGWRVGFYKTEAGLARAIARHSEES